MSILLPPGCINAQSKRKTVEKGIIFVCLFRPSCRLFESEGVWFLLVWDSYFVETESHFSRFKYNLPTHRSSNKGGKIYPLSLGTRENEAKTKSTFGSRSCSRSMHGKLLKAGSDSDAAIRPSNLCVSSICDKQVKWFIYALKLAKLKNFEPQSTVN